MPEFNIGNIIVYIVLACIIVPGVIFAIISRKKGGKFFMTGTKKNPSAGSGSGSLFLTPEQKDLFDRYFTSNVKGGCMSKTKIITDEEYVRRVLSKKNFFNPRSRAYAYLGIDETMVQEIPPVEFEGYLRRSENPLNKPVFYGASGMYTNIYESTWFFFSDSQIYIYRFVFDMLSGSTYDESREICYKDVTSFAVIDLAEEVDVSTVIAGGCFRRGGISNGKAIKRYMRFRVVVPGENADNLDYVMTANNELSSKIHAMQQKLREKKS